MTKKTAKVPAIVNQLAEIVMCDNPDTAEMLVEKAAAAAKASEGSGFRSPTIYEEDIRDMLEMIRGCQPKDLIEALLASQFAALHCQGMAVMGDPNGNKSHAMMMLRLSHSCLETLQRHRNKGGQNVNVNYFIKNDGQAVIGIDPGGLSKMERKA